jgi:hypothetical protein
VRQSMAASAILASEAFHPLRRSVYHCKRHHDWVQIDKDEIGRLPAGAVKEPGGSS